MGTYTKRLVAWFFAATLLSTAQAEDTVRILYKEPLQHIRMEQLTLAAEQQRVPETLQALRFDAFGRSFDINLEQNRAILGPELRARLNNRYGVYRGEIAGMPNSWVRLVVADGLPRGMLWNGSEFMAIDVTFDAVTGAEEAFIYRLSDLQIPAGALACGEISAAKNAAELAQVVVSEVSVNAAGGGGPTSQIDVAVIGDYEYTADNGSDTVAALTQRMNNVDGIFSTQLGVRINVTRIDTFAANNDPFSDVTAAGELLDELTDYRSNTPEQRANGLTHLFTGRDLDDNTVGVAYTGALCSPGFGAGLTQGSNNETLDSLISAHEFGHNFGAIHDGVEPPCEDVPETFLMAPQVNGSSEFSACSITTMQGEVSEASCVVPVPTTDVAVVAGGQQVVVLLGDNETLTFEANNVGSEDAGGVTVDVTIPSGVTLNSTTTTAGSCMSGAGNVSCEIGNVAAGSGETVSIGIAATSVGDYEFVASAVADEDADSSNNEASIQLTVEPAVDLISTAGAPAQVALNGSATINATVENRASIPATGVTLTVTPQTGLSVDSASWPAGSCSIANNVATCQADSLAPQSNNALQLSMTGSSAGNRTYAMAATSAETDRDPSDNDVNGQVTVSSPPGDTPDTSGDSGGGSLAWMSLFVLMLASLLGLPARRKPGHS